ncbi:hypothetical protein QVD17_01542 [Tagetes erecta]|uniref:Dof zinc finger protein n=1 Tax=Tagetes erecta TaxID=13708 RepID=A0AAD8L9Y5_TARER|nr:hypothetical protein QVD17_01542 [Tagetes erecta]
MGTNLDETGVDSSSASAITDPVLASSPPVTDQRLRPPENQPLKCPRCDSTHTKFCYYNNYSLTQPRYFCKTCRRYWTKGGTIRNIPVGGGCRKNKKVSSRSKRSNSATAVINSNDNIINHHQLVMNSNDLQLSSYPDSSVQFSGSDLFGVGDSSNNVASFMFENLNVAGNRVRDIDFMENGGGGGGNICSPFGVMTLDSINNPFMERGLIGYDDSTLGCALDVKPNLLALDQWQDNETGGAIFGGGDGGYMMGVGSTWSGLFNGYGPIGVVGSDHGLNHG